MRQAYRVGLGNQDRQSPVQGFTEVDARKGTRL